MSKRPNHATFAIRKKNDLIGAVKGWVNWDTQLTRDKWYARLPIQDEWALRQKRFRDIDLNVMQRRGPVYDIRAHHVRRF